MLTFVRLSALVAGLEVADHPARAAADAECEREKRGELVAEIGAGVAAHGRA
ncbi:MAG: hypothetical protein ACJ757_12945 [Gaiellaceae bacterium]